jgi:hypothetical protein
MASAVDFKDGKAVRWIDYWDGRSFGAETAAKMRTPPDKFPTNLDYDVASEGASAKIKDMSQKLASAFASGDAAAAAGYSPTMRSTSIGRCGCASLANRRSGSTSRAFAIDLSTAGQVERLDATWDNSIMTDTDLQALVLQSIEK